jgi:hypothetical protein
MCCTEDSQSLKGKTFLSCLDLKVTLDDVSIHHARLFPRISADRTAVLRPCLPSEVQLRLCHGYRRIVHYAVPGVSIGSLNTLLFSRVILCNLASVAEISGKY